MRGVCLFLLALLLAGHACAGDDLMTRYRAALQQQDITALAALIAPDASIRLTLELPQQQQMTFTLTRAELLQQQGALWYFSNQSDVTLTNVQTQGETVRFRQQSNYALFHQNYHLQSDIRLILTSVDGQQQITAITALSREE